MSSHPFDWKLLASQYLVQDRWLNVRADTCELPSARVIAPYYVLEYPTWINVVALTPHDVDATVVPKSRAFPLSENCPKRGSTNAKTPSVLVIYFHKNPMLSLGLIGTRWRRYSDTRRCIWGPIGV